MKKNAFLAVILSTMSLHSFADVSPINEYGRMPKTNIAAVSLVDYDTGAQMQTYFNKGSLYVAGQVGHRYAIRICNNTDGRIMTVVSVDGVNAITGKDANPNQSGYVLSPRSCTDVKGWRKSMTDVAEFVFSDPSGSYASQTGRPANTGVIGIAAYREKQPVYISPEYRSRSMESSNMADRATAGASPAAPMAKSELGTAHGNRITDTVSNTSFEKETSSPNQMTSIMYDTKENLIRKGIIPVERQNPNPWPSNSGFVPDPR